MSERVQEDVKSALASCDRHLEGASPLFVEHRDDDFVAGAMPEQDTSIPSLAPQLRDRVRRLLQDHIRFDVSQTEPLPGADPAPLETATPAADWRLAHRRGL